MRRPVQPMLMQLLPTRCMLMDYKISLRRLPSSEAWSISRTWNSQKPRTGSSRRSTASTSNMQMSWLPPGSWKWPRSTWTSCPLPILAPMLPELVSSKLRKRSLLLLRRLLQLPLLPLAFPSRLHPVRVAPPRGQDMLLLKICSLELLPQDRHPHLTLPKRLCHTPRPCKPPTRMLHLGPRNRP